jgi:ABC-type lipoprotein release transport system permease subunit
MTSLLFEVAAVDVATFAAVSAIMLGVAPIGCVVPALDAATSQPASVLRSE